MTSYENLKLLIDYFGVTGRDIAQTLDIDPSIISRYATGKRRLLAASPHAEALAEYFLSKSSRVADMDWLKARFQEAGLPNESSSVYRTKQNIIMLIASDGDNLRRNLAADPATVLAGETRPQKAETRNQSLSAEPGSGVCIGTLSIVMALTPLLGTVPRGGTVDIFLSSDRLTTVISDDIVALLHRSAEENSLTIRLVVCVSGDTRALSALLDAYLYPVISGHIKLYTVHGITQSVTDQLYLILPGQAVMLVTETPGGSAPPVATVVKDGSFISEMESSFAASFRYAQASLTLYGDEYTKDVIGILGVEYCAPGNLDVVKDSVNPLFMSRAAFDRFLKTRQKDLSEFAWRSAEFGKLKAGMDGNLQSGAAFREIIPLSRLNDIVRRGSCRMAGLYFAELGYVDLDARGCADILSGYIDYLEHQPNFSLLILDDLPELNGNNCWHIKQGDHVSVNNWQGDEPVMIYSDQLMLLREFQSRFDALWAKGAGAVGNRANVISILRDAAGHI